MPNHPRTTCSFLFVYRIIVSTLPEVIRDIERVGSEIVRQAATSQTVAPVYHTMKVAGPAFTVQVRPGDNLMVHAVIALARPGDMLVIDGKGEEQAARMGTFMLSACKQRGLVVVEGAMATRHVRMTS